MNGKPPSLRLSPLVGEACQGEGRRLFRVLRVYRRASGMVRGGYMPRYPEPLDQTSYAGRGVPLRGVGCSRTGGRRSRNNTSRQCTVAKQRACRHQGAEHVHAAGQGVTASVGQRYPGTCAPLADSAARDRASLREIGQSPDRDRVQQAVAKCVAVEAPASAPRIGSVAGPTSSPPPVRS